jgi:branched-chain amino acid transport system permease protein
MLQQYIIEGLVLGSVYAIASASLVVTFVSAGVLNFGFAAMAFFVARFFYWVNTQQGWPSIPAAALSLLVVAPLLGVILYGGLFRFVRGKSQLVKLVVTIGISVALPAISDLIFGQQAVEQAPGLAGFRVQTYKVFGTPVTADGIITFAFLAFVVVTGTVVLRYTDIGLRVRALVDSEAMASLSGTNPGLVSLGVWAVTTSLAGLAGILLVATQNLDLGSMTSLMAAAFAAVVAARFRSLGFAVLVSLAMGVVTDVIQDYLPSNSSFSNSIITSVPFAVIFIFLVYYVVRSGGADEDAQSAGPLDEAIKPANQAPAGQAGTAMTEAGPGRYLGAAPLLLVAVLPLIFHGSSLWMSQVALGACYAVLLLTFTVVTGEGGMLWLSQPMFAGAGALAAGQFLVLWHIPVLLAIVLGGLVAAAAGALIGVLTIRLGNLYVALATFTFALLMQTLVFTRSRFNPNFTGVVIGRPGFATSDFKFAYLALAVFALFGLLIVNLRRSTSGLALRAVRDSEPAARTLGISVLQVKVIVGALAAFVAGVGGGFIALWYGVANQSNYDSYAGLVWLAAVAAIGIRSIGAAAISGMTLALLQALFQTHLSGRWLVIPTIMFGMGAIGVARNPDGMVVQAGAVARSVLARVMPAGRGGGPPKPIASASAHPPAETSIGARAGS